MAVARIVCGACGADVPAGATTCPRCGSAVELPAVSGQGTGQVCPLCGFRNPASATFCESCGAKLPGSAAASPAAPAGRAAKQKQPVQAREKGRASSKERGAGVEVWQVISGVAVLALIVVIVYLLWPRGQSPAPQSVSSPQTQAVASMAEIQSLQQRVDSNPRDAGARLHLANALHDNGMLTRAIDNYNEYLKLEPKDPNARVDLGICYDQLALQDSVNAPRYFSLAVSEMGQAAAEAPTHQAAAFNLGIVNLHMDNLEESNKWFKRAVELGRNTEMGVRAQKLLQEHSVTQ